MEKPTTSAPHPAKQRSTRTQQNTVAILPNIQVIAAAAAAKPRMVLPPQKFGGISFFISDVELFLRLSPLLPVS